MLTTILLILNVVLYSFYVAGHIFDLSASVPNWKSGKLSDVSKMRDFYAHRSPKNFFLPIVILTPIVNLIALIMVWDLQITIPILIGIAFSMAIIVFVFTVRFFVPINQYLMESNENDKDKVKKMVGNWVRMDYVRLTLLIIGLLAAICSMYLYLIAI